MKKLVKLIAPLLGILLLAGCSMLLGCASVPSTKIKVGTLAIESPKQIGFTNLTATVKPGGEVHVSIGSYSSQNDSDVISSVLAGNIQTADRLILALDKLEALLKRAAPAAGAAGL